MQKYLLFLVAIFWISIVNSQKLPSQWRKTDDNRFIVVGDQVASGLYDESKVEDIRLYFTQTNYWTLLTQNYKNKIDLPAKLKYKGFEYDSVGVRFKGMTSYSMNNTQKKSFNISMDYVRNKQNLEGHKTLNLNNSWEDPSFMREVLYYKLIRNHSQSANANFVRLYINDQDWGIYQNVQQLNKDFIKEWYETSNGINMRADTPDGTVSGPGGPGGGGGGMWGDGTAALNYLGTDTISYKKYYTLKSSGVPDPWQQLIKACNVLNNSGSNLETEAPKVFDIDKILWHLACEIAFGDDDSYVYKGKMDYYLYWDEKTQRWTTFDYDANSTLVTAHVSWSPFYNETKVNYPLLNKLLAIPAFRQRYIAHMRTIIYDLLDETRVNALIDKYDALIRTAVLADTKKPYTNTAYINELEVLKNFIKNRKSSLLSNAEIKGSGPIIKDVSYSVNSVVYAKVTPDDNVVVKSTVIFASGLTKVSLYYCAGLSGVFSVTEMNDNGQNGDEKAGDGYFSATIPKFQAGSLIRFYVEAVGDDNVKSRTYLPAGAEHNVMFYDVEAKVTSSKTVVINEFMASNTGVVKDEFGETDDWIELYNNTDQDFDLSGYNLTDNADNLTKFTFTNGIKIKAKDYLIIWADEDKTQGPLHANFKLSASGESIILLDKNLLILDQITFGPQTTNKSSARRPNGAGDFVIGDHTFGKNNDSTSSVEEISRDDIIIYPNPASTSVFLSNPSYQDHEISIYNLSGIKRKSLIVPMHQIVQINDLSPGMYIIRCNNMTKKLIISEF